MLVKEVSYKKAAWNTVEKSLLKKGPYQKALQKKHSSKVLPKRALKNR